MAVPDFQTWFMPLLRRLEDGAVHEMNTLFDQLADDLKLTPEERAEVLPSGKQFTYRNRIGWARTYLKKAGLLHYPGRSLVQITDAGRGVLASPPARLDVRFLRTIPSFLDFHTHVPTDRGAREQEEDESTETETPEEALARIHGRLERQLSQDLLERVKAAPPEFFERLVLDLLLKMGYGDYRDDAGQHAGRSGDGGIDGLINEDPLGLEVVCIQAKRWEHPVGRPTVQAFAGSLEGFRAKKGVLITTSSFTADAKAYVQQIEKRIVLIDGERLAGLMVKHNVAVSTVLGFEIKRIDTDYFEVE
jgi:restriction system protein